MRGRFALLAALGAAALSCLLSAASAQPDEYGAGLEKRSPGVWPDRVYHWYYNGANHPAWLGDDEARAWVQEAARKWEVCGVKMQYEGETDRAPMRMDGRNVVGWRDVLPRGARGITVGPAARGVLVERDIAFSSGREEFHRYPRLLKKVLVHEFGHAIGLTHSSACNDVMTLAADCPRADPATLPLFPTGHDLARCKALYP
ncbi:MAG TPA: matrixin family metalloprotease [Ramlibacter sp.]|uniref:matrixin family metalloprotease n=1 Tax=Ramlibacter sp. TaxID=1917967 RepID=UPI002CF04762|nr:matrixin family metalloprotease [Ramlibacter sp.]HVZ46150.1 matrixin family metalloprotease [Ramlibacter sp.]